MLIKCMQEAIFYINAKGFLFIMRGTVLIALLKKECQQSNIVWPWKIIFSFSLLSVWNENDARFCLNSQNTGSQQRNQKRYCALPKKKKKTHTKQAKKLHHCTYILIKKQTARVMEEGISIPFDAFNCSSYEWSESLIPELQHRASYF